MKFKNIVITSLIVIIFGVSGVYRVNSQVKPRVAGLESNEEYMSLLEEESRLHSIEDSIINVVAKMRGQYREFEGDLEGFRNEIVRLENEVFEVRNRAGILAGKINGIEQEYILQNLDKPSHQTARESTASALAASKSDTLTNIVYNDFFKQNIPLMDYDALLRAQESEIEVVELSDQYISNYDIMVGIFDEYQAIDNQEEADSLMERYRYYEELNFEIEDNLTEKWSYIVDNKLYAYSYMLDKFNMMERLDEFEEKLNAALDSEAQIRATSQSIAVASYPILKELLLDYERAFAELLDIVPAVDSIRKAGRGLNTEKFRVDKIDMRERIFIDYEDIEVHSPAIYNASNPIPECEIYERGVIYRVLLGNYGWRQNISTFRGVAPLSYERGGDKRFRYYTGGFETLTEAQEGVDTLKKIGFKAPKIVVWDYGVYSEFDEEGNITSDSDNLYRLEISGAGDDLSNDVKEVLRELAGNRDVLRAGELFFVSPFEAPSQAEAVADAIRQADRRLTVIISEIPL